MHTQSLSFWPCDWDLCTHRPLVPGGALMTMVSVICRGVSPCVVVATPFFVCQPLAFGVCLAFDCIDRFASFVVQDVESNDLPHLLDTVCRKAGW